MTTTQQKTDNQSNETRAATHPIPPDMEVWPIDELLEIQQATLRVFPFDVQRKACAYVTRIRNHNKRTYANEYLMKTLRNEDTNGIKHECSYMAAQSVRLHLATILGD